MVPGGPSLHKVHGCLCRICPHSPRRAYGPSPLTPRRIFDPSRDLCTTTGCFCCTVQITFYPHPPLILREPQHERPRPHRGRLGKNLIKGEGMERSHIIQFLGSPSRASGQASTSLMPRRIFDRASRTPRPWRWKPNSGAGMTIMQGAHTGRKMRACAGEVKRCQR